MSGFKRILFWFLSQWKWMEFLSGRGYNISVPSSTACELLNRWRRWHEHPAEIWRGGGTDGGVWASYQSWFSDEELGQGLVNLTSLRLFCLQSWIFLFLPRFSVGGLRILGLDLANIPIRVREDIRGVVWKVSWNVTCLSDFVVLRSQHVHFVEWIVLHDIKVELMSRKS